jgi:hypothetical protein
MTEPIELLGYAKTDARDQLYYFIRSSEVDQVVNLKDYVVMLHPFKTKEGKDKIRLIFRPADNKQKGE